MIKVDITLVPSSGLPERLLGSLTIENSTPSRSPAVYVVRFANGTAEVAHEIGEGFLRLAKKALQAIDPE